MATNYQEPGHLPEGVVLAHTLYGEPDTSVNNDYALNSTMGPVQQAPFSGVPYYEDVMDRRPIQRHGRRDGHPHCQREGCNAWCMRDSDFCRWHQDVA